LPLSKDIEGDGGWGPYGQRKGKAERGEVKEWWWGGGITWICPKRRFRRNWPFPLVRMNEWSRQKIAIGKGKANEGKKHV
jgi:hypothetical protein